MFVLNVIFFSEVVTVMINLWEVLVSSNSVYNHNLG